MKFELGKCYKHESGSKYFICGIVNTEYHGICLVGENELGELHPVGMEEANAENFKEISKEEFFDR